MTISVLIAFASRHGSTAEIAEVIGEVLRRRGLEVDLREAADVRSARGYDGVVLGSAVYHGHWQDDARHLLGHLERELKDLPVWLFSSGPTGGTDEADAEVRAVTASAASAPPPTEVAKGAARIGARGHATFAGRIGEDMVGFLERWMPRGDWRDWDQVRHWADAIADELIGAPAEVSS